VEQAAGAVVAGEVGADAAGVVDGGTVDVEIESADVVTDDVVTQRARLAVAAIFFVNGALFANWVARVPAVKDGIDAGPGALGLALLGLAVGSLVTMPWAGRVCERIGSDRAILVSGLAAALAVAGPALAVNAPTLGLALAFYGGSFGLMDVAMNVQAVAVVRRVGRPIMPWFHAAFSVGGLAGAGMGALAAGAGLSPLAHFALAGLAAAGVVLAAVRHLLADGPTSSTSAVARDARRVAGDPGSSLDGGEQAAGTMTGVVSSEAGPRAGTGPRRGRRGRRDGRSWLLAGLGAIAACAALGEGAMADWTALFLRDVTGTGAGVAALGFAAFSITMTAGRVGGEAAIRRLGAVRVLRLGGTLAAVGILLAVVVASPVAGLIGFALVGLGSSCAFPLALTTAGESSDGSGSQEIATVSVVGYLGFLVGPPTIGLLAEVVELRAAMTAIIVPALGLVALAHVVGRANPDDHRHREESCARQAAPELVS
jgi:predicted MFS family arabinose efflux permease